MKCMTNGKGLPHVKSVPLQALAGIPSQAHGLLWFCSWTLLTVKRGRSMPRKSTLSKGRESVLRSASPAPAVGEDFGAPTAEKEALATAAANKAKEYAV